MLKEKFAEFKERSAEVAMERDELLNSKQKIEMRLKQAQVILNENDLKCYGFNQ